MSRLADKSASRINQIVRGYLDAIDRDQERAGVCFAKTQRGEMHYDESGKEAYTPSETCLHIVELLDLIDSASPERIPSYARNSRKIRQQEGAQGCLLPYTVRSRAEEGAHFKEQIEDGDKAGRRESGLSY